MQASAPTLSTNGDIATLEQSLRAAPARLTPRTLASLLDVTTRTLANWRKAGKGPPYLALGPRKIRYETSAVQVWLAGLADTTSITCAHCGALRPAPRVPLAPAPEGTPDA